MGSCLSAHSSTPSPPLPTAKIITSNGHLREYPLPATVSRVLDQETASSPSFFMCNSDGLNYDRFIPVLDLDEPLQPNQIYFILPKSKLQHPLSAADMAAMAVSATSALTTSTAFYNDDNKVRNRRHKSRISPILAPKQRVSVSAEMSADDIFNPVKPDPSGVGNNRESVAGAAMMTKSGSVRRLQRYTSRRAKMAVRSFRLRLSTIYEGATLGREDSRFN